MREGGDSRVYGGGLILTRVSLFKDCQGEGHPYTRSGMYDPGKESGLKIVNQLKKNNCLILFTEHTQVTLVF